VKGCGHSTVFISYLSAVKLISAFGILTRLIGYRATGFTGRLARGLTRAAGFAAGRWRNTGAADDFNMFHLKLLPVALPYSEIGF
jgi:hypothetical protein